MIGADGIQVIESQGIHVAGRRNGTGRLAAGLGLIAVFWWLNWQSFRLGPVTVWAFFPLWLGYILTADGLAAVMRGTSLFERDRRRFFELFLYSIPLWWLFEYMNVFLTNWTYVGGEGVHPAARFVFASLSFSTVIPAVFVTAELLAPSMPAWLAGGPRRNATPRVLAAAVVSGFVLFAAITIAPQLFYPAAWLCVVLVVDPMSHALGWPSVTSRIARGDWRLAVTMAVAALVCGFFWELWNVHSSPKWIYNIPYLGVGKVFEMPILGFGGYLPFGLEVYCVYCFLAGLTGRGADSFPGWSFAADSPSNTK